jgi:hypothetical protein
MSARFVIRQPHRANETQGALPHFTYNIAASATSYYLENEKEWRLTKMINKGALGQLLGASARTGTSAKGLVLRLRNLLCAGGIALLLVRGLSLFLRRLLVHGFRRFVTHNPKSNVHDKRRQPGRRDISEGTQSSIGF